MRKVHDPRLLQVQLQVRLRQQPLAFRQRFPGLLLRLRQDHEIVRVPDQFAPALLQFPVEILQEEVGQQRRNRRTLGNAAQQPVEVAAVPDAPPHPLPHQVHEQLPRLPLAQALEEQIVVHAVEKGVDVAVDAVDVPQLPALADARDGPVHRTARTVTVTALQEFLLEGAREMPRDGGLEDAVGDGGYQQGASGGRPRMLLDDDLEEGKGTVRAFVDALV